MTLSSLHRKKNDFPAIGATKKWNSPGCGIKGVGKPSKKTGSGESGAKVESETGKKWNSGFH